MKRNDKKMTQKSILSRTRIKSNSLANLCAKKIAVIGLGYVGLPLALAFSRTVETVVGFDVDESKVCCIKQGFDPNGEIDTRAIQDSNLIVTTSEGDLKGSDFYVVAVPTPVGAAHVPDLTYVKEASELVGRVIAKGAIVCYESTVYPGVTEDICAPIIANVSGLRRSVDFFVGYSPERINPGDTANRLETIVKVVSGENAETQERLKNLYKSVVSADIYLAPSIKVAEAAKVIENIQRDINIALINELALIFDRMNIRTEDVLKAAGTKWNFLRFSPGLVGGHCIGVDPYYLTYKSEELGYCPQVILAGRRINDGMAAFIAQKTIKLLHRSGINKINGARIGILGITFKENVADMRNSKIPDIVQELKSFGTTVLVHDPLGNSRDAMLKYGIELSPLSALKKLDAVILAVAHDNYKKKGVQFITDSLKNGKGVLVDVKSVFQEAECIPGIIYWSL
jgi:UDP-N-acetyl-D-galactosamine dehydrogenase